jgi:hypothetical protein
VSDERRARLYVLLHPRDCIPPHPLDPTPGGRDELKVERLAEHFRKEGFNPAMPALVGYPLLGMVQLLTGTHRHEAALRASIYLPVSLRLRSDVGRLWGTDGWADLVADVPVLDLEQALVPETMPILILEEAYINPELFEWRK